MIDKLKRILGKKNSLSTPTPVSIDDYLEEIEEIPITPVEEEKTIIKVCSIEDEKDAVNAVVMAEAGYIVIAKTPNLEKEIDEEFIEIIKKMRNEALKFGGNLIILGEEHLLITPKNVVIEKLIKEKKEESNIRKENKEKTEEKEQSNE
ncbi:cell division protein SepF [Methanocaldococcus fervens]|nr:cell division protein SepF [Methanocaldococcus fervens]